MGSIPEINCVNGGCATCEAEVGDTKECCECAWLEPEPEEIFGEMISPVRRSLPLKSADNDTSAPDEAKVSDLHARAGGGVTSGYKLLTFWSTQPMGSMVTPVTVQSDSYPAYLNNFEFPFNTKNFDDPAWSSVKKYFHNSTAVCSSFDVS